MAKKTTTAKKTTKKATAKKTTKPVKEPKVTDLPAEAVEEAPKPKAAPKTKKISLDITRGTAVTHTPNGESGKVMFVHKNRIMVDFGDKKHFCEPNNLVLQ